MLSFHNDIEIKNKYLSRVRAHQAADNLIRGTGWDGGKGCAVGCTLESYDHSRYQIELGLPEWLAHVEDKLFEGMSLEKSKTFPELFLAAIPVGVDLESVKWKMAVFILTGLVALVTGLKISQERKDSIIDVIRGSIAVNQNAIDTGEWDFEAVKKARAAATAAYTAAASAASAADAYAADAYAYAYAAYAAYAASASASAATAAYAYAYAYAYAAASAYAASAYAADAYAADAYAAAAAYAADARIKVYDKYADELLRLLAEAKQ